MSHSSKKSKVERTYEFFRLAEEEQRSISLNDFTTATGYTFGTARTYIAKKWSRFLTPIGTGDLYMVKGVQNQTLQDFTALLQRRLPAIQPASPQRLMLSLPDALGEWLSGQAIQQECSVQDIILDVLERHRQMHEGVQRE